MLLSVDDSFYVQCLSTSIAIRGQWMVLFVADLVHAALSLLLFNFVSWAWSVIDFLNLFEADLQITSSNENTFAFSSVVLEKWSFHCILTVPLSLKESPGLREVWFFWLVSDLCLRQCKWAKLVWPVPKLSILSLHEVCSEICVI